MNKLRSRRTGGAARRAARRCENSRMAALRHPMPKKHRRRGRAAPALLFVVCLGLSPTVVAAEIRIGVLAWLGAEASETQWVPFVSSLQQAVPDHRFVLRQFDLDGMGQALERREVDFVVTNPGHYVTLEARVGITRLATAVSARDQDPAHIVGATVVALATRNDLDRLEDLRGRRVAAVSAEAFGGYQLAWAELARRGIDPERGDVETRFTGFPMTSVLDAVNRGEADAGVIRTCLLERLIAERKIAPDRFKVLSARVAPRLACRASSALYPGWAFAAASQVPAESSRQVLLALLALPPTANGQAWSVPADYQPVHALLRELKIGPYLFLRDFDLASLARRYWPILAFGATLLLAWLAYTLRVERLVQRRTRELTQALDDRRALEQRVRAEQERMEHLSRLSILGELSGTLAHELNQPLATIGNYAQSLVRRADRGTLTDDALRQASAEIASEAGRAAQILAGIRAFARKRGRVREAHHLPALVAEAIALFRGMLPQAPAVQVMNALPARADPADVDPLQIQQVVLNLLKNAQDSQQAAGAADVPIEVRLDADGQEFGVAVRDHGSGLGDELRGRLFEPFFTTKSDGLGLGLSICASIVEAHGGRLAAASPESGRGAVFRFTLPRRARAVTANDSAHDKTTP